MSDLQILMDRAHISDNLIRYALALDRGDRAVMEDLFWADGTCDYGKFSGSAAEFIGHFAKAIGVFAMTQHVISNILIEFDGAKARSQAYFNAHHEFGDKEPIHVAGRYLDKHERRDGVWKIVHRLFVLDWHSGGETEDDFPISKSTRHLGAYKPDDPWYRM